MILAPLEIAGAAGALGAAEAQARAAGQAADTARVAAEAASQELALLGARWLLARHAAILAGAGRVAAKFNLTDTAVAWFVDGTQPPSLSAELLDVGARATRARKEVTAGAALDQRLERWDEARQLDATTTAELDRIGALLPEAHRRAEETAAASQTADAARAVADATLAERRAVVDSLSRRVSAAVAATGPGGVNPAGVTFPVAGPWEFHDDWGDPRSGGRRHKGTDVFGLMGTPLVAIEAGTARADSDLLGGTTVFLSGRSGTLYYYAHLSGIHPAVLASGANGLAVEAGQVVGFLGDSGNAAGGAPHLHIQVAPNGSDWVNPYPLLAALANAVSAARGAGATATIPPATLARLKPETVAALRAAGILPPEPPAPAAPATPAAAAPPPTTPPQAG